MSDSLNQLKALAAPAELRRAPVVENNQGLGWLTDKLSAFAEGKTPLWWWILFIPAAFAGTVIFPDLPVLSGVYGRRRLGQQPPGDVGPRHRELHLVGRCGPCRYIDFCAAVSHASALADHHRPHG